MGDIMIKVKFIVLGLFSSLLLSACATLDDTASKQDYLDNNNLKEIRDRGHFAEGSDVRKRTINGKMANGLTYSSKTWFNPIGFRHKPDCVVEVAATNSTPRSVSSHRRIIAIAYDEHNRKLSEAYVLFQVTIPPYSTVKSYLDYFSTGAEHSEELCNRIDRVDYQTYIYKEIGA